MKIWHCIYYCTYIHKGSDRLVSKMYPSIVKCSKTAVNCSVASVADWRAGLAGASGNWVRRLFPCQSEQLKVERHLDFLRDEHYSDGFNVSSYRAEFQTFFEATHCNGEKDNEEMRMIK